MMQREIFAFSEVDTLPGFLADVGMGAQSGEEGFDAPRWRSRLE